MLRPALLSLLALFAIACPAFSQATVPHVATTANDATVDLDILKLKLRPLSAAQVEAEANAWLTHLVAINTRISGNEVLTLQATGDTTQLANELPGLLDQRTRILDRMNATLRALSERGGETKPFDQYIAASTKTGFSFAFVTAWVTSPEGGIRFGLNLLKFLFTLLAFKILSSIAAGITRKAVSRLKRTSDLLRDFMVSIVRRVTFFIGLIMALPMLDINITPFVNYELLGA